MYHTAVTVDLKEKVLQSFCSVNGSEWQIVTAIATTALGLGIDCPDIRRVYHWGLPSDLDSYVQESGRAGRDQQQSDAILWYGNVPVYTNAKCAIMQKQHSADVSPCSRISCWEKTYTPLYRDANAATFVKHCANAAHACLLTDETEHVYIHCVYLNLYNYIIWVLQYTTI